MTEQQKFEAWLGIRPCGAAHDFGLAAWQARAAQDRSAELLEALEESRRWIGDGECADGLHRDLWTPQYAAAVDKVDAALSAAKGGGRVAVPVEPTP